LGKRATEGVKIMALCCGDIHGNYPKAKAFLEYRPEKEHVFVGDYFDSFRATDSLLAETAKMIFDSNSICLVGNHDMQYFSNATAHMKCSGFRPEAFSFIHLMEMYKHRIQATYVVDDFIVAHGGIVRELGRHFDDINELSEWINSEFDQFKNDVVIRESHSRIFNISGARGGSDTFSGPFWADYRYENYDVRFNQVFGHSHTSAPYELQTEKFTQLICVDCPQYICFNTETKNFEDFFPEEFKRSRDMLEKAY
jgi:hypothetical protein